jgi:hypothetical protein
MKPHREEERNRITPYFFPIVHDYSSLRLERRYVWRIYTLSIPLLVYRSKKRESRNRVSGMLLGRW